MLRPTEHRWVIVGAGRLGGLVALMAADAGVEDLMVWSRSGRPSVDVGELHVGAIDSLWAEADDAVVWLTVVDQAIESVAQSLRESGVEPALTLHGSGSLSSNVLKDAGVPGPVGSLHPLLSVATPVRALDKVSDTAWTYEGSAEGRAVAEWLLAAHDNEPRIIEPDKKLLYHAAAVTASGLVTATVDMALEVARAAGLGEADAREMLVPLLRSTVENLREQRPVDALTGPVAREDDSTIRAHLTALEALENADLVKTYRLLTRRLASEELRDRAGLDD